MADHGSKVVCSYCGSLIPAIVGDHNCSVTGVIHPPDSVGNSFYVKTRHLSSELHLSRLSFRSVLEGYQHYRVDDRDFLLNSTNYLVVREGTKYQNQIESSGKTESIIVVFGQKVQKEVELTYLKSDEFLLDNPDFLALDTEVDFFQATYEQDDGIRERVQIIKNGIKSGDKDPLFFQQVQYDLMGLMVKKHVGTAGIRGKKGHLSTKMELYRRTRLALDYIEANFNEKISIDYLSKVASLSPFHFIRTFKQFYGVTPGEYIGKTRLKYAHYLLTNSDLPIAEIMPIVGFKNHSSFSRLFKASFGTSPRECRQAYNKSNIRTIIPIAG